MKDNCGRSLYLGFASQPSGQLEYYGDDDTDHDNEREDCTVVIEPGIGRESIAFQFREMQLPSGLCLTVRQRSPKIRITYSISGTASEYCGNYSIPAGVEFRTERDKELLVTVSGGKDKGAEIILQFTLYNEKDLKATCDLYKCVGGRCDPLMECSYGYSPCDFHVCPDPDSRSDGQPSNLHIYGIVFGILIGLSMCMCRFAVKSSDIKEDILNRVQSTHRNGGQRISRIEEPDCHDANRYQSFVIEDLLQSNRVSRRNSSDLELRRTPSQQTVDHITIDHETSRFITGQAESPSSFSAIVECNFHYTEYIPRTSPNHSRHASRTNSRQDSRNNSRHASRSNSRHASRSGSRHASRSGSRHASRSGSRHASRNGSPIPNISFPDILSSTTSHTDYSGQYTPTSRRSLHDLLHGDLPPPFSSVVSDDAASSRHYSFETEPTSLTSLPDNYVDKCNSHGNARDIDTSGRSENIPLRSLCFDEVGQSCQPPSYEEVIAHEEKYNIKQT